MKDKILLQHLLRSSEIKKVADRIVNWDEKITLLKNAKKMGFDPYILALQFAQRYGLKYLISSKCASRSQQFRAKSKRLNEWLLREIRRRN